MKESSKFRAFVKPAFWGIVLILAAVVLILDGVGVSLGQGMTPWRIVAAVLLAGWLIYEIARLKLTNVFFPAAFLFLVMEEPIAAWMGRGEDATDLIADWIVLVAALLLTAGTKAIFHRRSDDEHAVSGGRIGSQTFYFDAADLSNALISDRVGPTEVYLTNTEEYPGGGTIKVRDTVGPVTIHLPDDWHVVAEAVDIIGNLNVPRQDGVARCTVNLDVKDAVGGVNVVFDKTQEN